MRSHRIRKFLSPLIAVALAAVAATSLVVLERRAHGYRTAEAMLANASAQFALLGAVPVELSSRPAALRATDGAIHSSEAAVRARLAELTADWPIPALGAVSVDVNATIAAVDQLTGRAPAGVSSGGSVGAQDGGSLPGAGVASDPAAKATARRAAREGGAAKLAIGHASRDYDQMAIGAQQEALVATLIAIFVLLCAFLVFYFRWLGILQRTEHDARSDPLTGLGNRRALIEQLAAQLEAPSAKRRLVLTLYDLDGFKQYNDAFGHLAGDALLTRFASRLSGSLGESGSAYRMGGDEFCSLASVAPNRVSEHISHARELLGERGEGFAVTCSAGSAVLPAEAGSSRDALALADSRMYEHKGLSKRRPDRAQSAQIA